MASGKVVPVRKTETCRTRPAEHAFGSEECTVVYASACLVIAGYALDAWIMLVPQRASTRSWADRMQEQVFFELRELQSFTSELPIDLRTISSQLHLVLGC